MLAELMRKPVAESSGFHAAYLNDAGGIWHFHPEYELMLNLKSYGTRIIGNNVELFDRHAMTLVAGNIPHSWSHYKGSEGVPENHGIVCHFSEEALGDSFLSQYEMTSLRDLLKESHNGLAFSVDDAHRAEPYLHEMISLTGLKKMIAFFSLMDILCSSDKKRVLCSQSYSSAAIYGGDMRMLDAYAYVSDNYQKNITLKEVADVAKMSPSAFSKHFRKHAGAGLVEYINQVRANRACYMLRETDEQISVIALACGFRSISNFNRLFRKFYSLAPGEYRELYR